MNLFTIMASKQMSLGFAMLSNFGKVDPSWLIALGFISVVLDGDPPPLS